MSDSRIRRRFMEKMAAKEEISINQKIQKMNEDLDAIFVAAGVRCAFVSLELPDGTSFEIDHKCTVNSKLGLVNFAKMNIDQRVKHMINSNIMAQAAESAKRAKGLL